MTSVTLNNTPALVTSTTPGSSGMAGSYGAYSPAAGDTLVALVAAASTNGSIAATAMHSGTTGWAKQAEIFCDGATPANVLVAMWTRYATGGDAAPAFTASSSGGTSAGAIVIAALGNTGPTSWDGTGNYASGGSSATIASVTVASTSNVSVTGDYALAILARQRASGSTTYSSGSWTTLASTSAASVLQMAADGLSGPSTGAPVSDTGTWTGTATAAFAAALAVVFTPFVPGGNTGGFFDFL